MDEKRRVIVTSSSWDTAAHSRDTIICVDLNRALWSEALRSRALWSRALWWWCWELSLAWWNFAHGTHSYQRKDDWASWMKKKLKTLTSGFNIISPMRKSAGWTLKRIARRWPQVPHANPEYIVPFGFSRPISQLLAIPGKCWLTRFSNIRSTETFPNGTRWRARISCPLSRTCCRSRSDIWNCSIFFHLLSLSRFTVEWEFSLSWWTSWLLRSKFKKRILHSVDIFFKWNKRRIQMNAK